jgi:aspartate 1-decarboxylase
VQTVTHADLQYEGSLSIDRSLMDAADIAPFEEVHIWNVTRGTRLATYAIEAPSRSGVICANGAAAHHISVGDLIIIATFQLVASPADATAPVVIQVDERNRAIGKCAEVAGPKKYRQISSAFESRRTFKWKPAYTFPDPAGPAVRGFIL